MQAFEKENGMVKYGFSKTEKGQRVLVAGFQDKKDKDTMNASRILVLSSVQASTNMKKFGGIETETPVSTGSGVKLTPLKQ